MDEKFLITGASGCIGSWVLYHLQREGAAFVASDLRKDLARPRLLMEDDALDAIAWIELDVTDGAAVRAAVEDHGITHIVHLAGLQVPFVKANPPLGAAVNVTGTTNIFEAARHCGVSGLSYASSMAVFGPATAYPPGRIADDAPRLPDTLYGVTKMANEDMARIYWQEWEVGSVGLRPGVVYGVGRDQGISSDTARALLAVAAGAPFHIRFDGPVALQHASDVARMFIGCARAGHRGAAACNLRNDVVEVADFVDMVLRQEPGAQITYERGTPLPVAADYDDAALRGVLGEVPHIPLERAIETDIAQFRALLARGLLQPESS
ncbi:NAD(P)-dependent oxidoreductase [Aestuariicoccus sp. MJ-SS9]|uniref:NAD-dependent epimerase/dehydratase family protein n=1 Tax=Aestuariicoccus sp. MJ-SS9 TaxID=3079855 RepID=UPI002912D3A9|nr:NAD(P)-dependent oxidoreductase [Aestuariicoccus sp. MJ-SS9]MDU8910485.1 NAD(P)-dependent oxidoreductase [Aestuariicoccus sp. MJ-SS9]